MTDETEDLDTLLPDATVHVGGRDVTVREFRFAEGLRATPLARPILQGLRELIDTHGEHIPPEGILALMSDHADAWTALIALSCGEDEAWIRELGDEDGLTLQMTFWQVNQRFFVRRLMLAAAMARGVSASSTSSASSSPPATGGIPPSSPSATPGARSSATGEPSSAADATGERTASRR